MGGAPMKTEFASVLSGLRRNSGLSQKKAADDLGISQALLSHYENGVREPKLEFILKACDYYGVTADCILGRTTETTAGDKLVLEVKNQEERRCGDAAKLIAAILSEVDDDGLRCAASQYLAYSLYVILSALRTPAKPYDPLLDAAAKTAEAVFLDHVRKAGDAAGGLPILPDDALRVKYPDLFNALREIDNIIGSSVSGLRELTDRQRTTL
jgi:transcriptional regulator with XRE-family HTH domain